MLHTRTHSAHTSDPTSLSHLRQAAGGGASAALQKVTIKSEVATLHVGFCTAQLSHVFKKHFLTYRKMNKTSQPTKAVAVLLF